MREPAATIRIAAALIDDHRGRLLLVRKTGTASFMQPGGKIEPGEKPLRALARELREEIGLTLGTGQARHLGCFSAPAANEPGWTVTAELFHIRTSGIPAAGGEIAEAGWFDLNTAARLVLAPLTRDQVLPLAAALSALARP
ncbi:NUDIX hydrolase [Allosphingosinicella deserti]|uniref:DNA mismatch repair protein MutT n=1 Tax=Allosphingosinicella deserti TaxID=2116704 RepID=A0A2P7QHE9_9SPHN|nr:NUDIX domain-containing protein [Sphingomonas deserti]PSJ37385.1 DNA mismatch repair protein MutT [Sphingomonas deserti]